jgi:hypothetical protein
VSDVPAYEPDSYEPDAFETADEDVPTMDELDRVAFDAVVRSAPRFGRFIGTGVGIGFVVGLIIGLVLPNTTSVGRSVVAIMVASGFAIIGGLVAGALVVTLDGTKKAPAESGFPWEAPSETDTSVGQEPQ